MNKANNFKITLFPVNDWTRTISRATNECLDIYQLNREKKSGGQECFSCIIKDALLFKSNQMNAEEI